MEEFNKSNNFDKEKIEKSLAFLIYYNNHNKFLDCFFKFTQIAFPGSLEIYKSVGYINNKKLSQSFGNGIGNLYSMLPYFDFETTKWPKPIKISVKSVWEYIINKTSILENFSKTDIERALNSYSNMFSDKDSNDHILNSMFWAISGLEAIYSDGEIGITQQLNEKTQVFLGEINENKKMIKELYNFRSKLIHGKLSIPINGEIIDDNEHFSQLINMSSFASVILTISLQKIIKNEMTKLSFNYTYN